MPRTGYRIDIDVERLVRLYVSEQRTVDHVAVALGLSATTVTRRLVELGIDRRPRGPIARAQALPVQWTADLAWVVGLVATDGNLSPHRGNLAIVSKDTDLLETVRHCLGITVGIRPHRGGFSSRCQRLQWHDRALYDWFLQIGLTPRKSLTLGRLDVPDRWFPDFLRGCIDGDGSITVYVDDYNARKNERYVYERLWVSLVSASRTFIEWIATTVARLFDIAGSVSVRHRVGRAPIWKLKYGKQASIDLIRRMYYVPGIPSLERKRLRAAKFLWPLGSLPKRSGRPRAGWQYNETPTNAEI
ncbi:MAG: hypothetical protein HYU41_04425 [Candidatus Rokubacteria bacterium]|nr:hypothetical protein [Candidatus Rokubacteria bacterium]